jgi:hypothetical protein
VRNEKEGERKKERKTTATVTPHIHTHTCSWAEPCCLHRLCIRVSSLDPSDYSSAKASEQASRCVPALAFSIPAALPLLPHCPLQQHVLIWSYSQSDYKLLALFFCLFFKLSTKFTTTVSTIRLCRLHCTYVIVNECVKQSAAVLSTWWCRRRQCHCAFWNNHLCLVLSCALLILLRAVQFEKKGRKW